MNWNTAINILANRQTVENENENGSEMVLEAAHTAYTLVAEHCTTDTDGLGDWLENGDWSGDIPTPADVAQEWDDLSE
jgi:hypothetical protein